ncbi:lamin tail domain-containing protein [Polyangium mundeleinium]|uniref:Lamin tail domain-containing protein n=1 Tax=Polyangium mundeleinium TaxID=2995306 RepID=A0ABT5F005_9BACT|nr:lamin tail domain-containing protein [Polyangium mundeleinium]MDC0746763.1 lamin tail domain-containing protein [Polyangium mundeleinium]
MKKRIVRAMFLGALAAFGSACAEGSPPDGDGGAGQGGQGGSGSCRKADDCQPSANPCETAICKDGACVAAPVPAGTSTPEQKAGDCVILQCDGAGEVIPVPEDSDVPVDGNPCTSDVCTSGIGSNPPVPTGTACGDAGSICNSDGACVECLTAADCPGSDTTCQARTCVMGVCGVENAAAGTPLPSQMPGDCMQMACDGSGGTSPEVDDSDVPVDGNACTADVCAAGAPSNPPISLDTACNQNGGKVCNGAGLCVQCNAGAQCPSGVCAAGVCKAASCADGVENGSETDVDCGGAGCPPCGVGESCLAPADCHSGLCATGLCQPPAVVGTSPADAATGAPVTSTVAVTFSGAMDPATLAAQTTVGPCTGVVQVSTDGFATCLGFAAALPVMSGNGTVATWTPSPALSYGTTYRVRVAATAKGTDGTALAAAYTSSVGFGTATPPTSAPCASSVVISQIYGGGGNSGATYKSDFIELHNRGSSSVNLAGWSVQYASAAGTSWLVTNLSGTLAPGGYYLVAQAGGSSGVALPASDATGTTNMSASAGKIALVNATAALSGSCPSGAKILDFVGYGTTANCFKGSGVAPGASTAAQSIQRLAAACTDTGDNKADFATAQVAPRSSASMASACACAGDVTANESDQAYELDFCNVELPVSLTVSASAMTPVIYGRAYEAGVTEAADASATLKVEVGFGPANINPTTQSGWQFFSATYNAQIGNDDEYKGSFLAPAVPGAYRYAYRMSLDGTRWTYCDLNGAGSGAGLSFEITQLPALTVVP